MKGVVVRIRPAQAVSEGYSRERINRICDSLYSAHSEDAEVRTWRLVGQNPFSNVPDSGFRVHTVEYSDGMADSVQNVADRILVAIKKSRVKAGIVLIDAAFDWVNLGRAFILTDQILAAVLSGLRRMRMPGTHVVILVDRLPTVAEQYFLELGSATSGVSVYARDGGSIRRSSWLTDESHENVLGEISAGLGDRFLDLRRGTLRKRGVFRSSSPASPTYFLFHYSLQAAGVRNLVGMLVDYFIDNSTEMVVYDEQYAPDWFREAFSVAASRLSPAAPFVSMQALQFEQEASSEDFEMMSLARELIAGTDSRICYVVPAIDTGLSLKDLIDRVGRPLSEADSFLSVYANESRMSGSVSNAGDFVRFSLFLSGRSRDIDVLLPVPFEILSSESWQVEAASQSRDVRSDQHPDLPARYGVDALDEGISFVGLLSLIESLGVGVETPTPVHRRPVANYPKFHNLESWDAQWLAEHLLSLVEDRLGAHRSTFLVLVPQERSPNGTPVIARAFEEYCGVNVVEVKRAVLEGRRRLDPKTKAELARYSATKLIAFDESTVSGKTLERFDKLLDAEFSRSVSQYVVLALLGLATPGTREKTVWLLNWRPLIHSSRLLSVVKGALVAYRRGGTGKESIEPAGAI